MIINMNGAKAPETPSSVLQEKTVTPETLPTVIGPDAGYDGLTQVTVNPDAQLKAENIRSGKTIFGVQGAFTGETSYVDAIDITKLEYKGSTNGLIVPLFGSLGEYGALKGAEMNYTYDSDKPSTGTISVPDKRGIFRYGERGYVIISFKESDISKPSSYIPGGNYWAHIEINTPEGVYAGSASYVGTSAVFTENIWSGTLKLHGCIGYIACAYGKSESMGIPGSPAYNISKVYNIPDQTITVTNSTCNISIPAIQETAYVTAYSQQTYGIVTLNIIGYIEMIP